MLAAMLLGAAPPGLDAVHAGDDAWDRGDRREARLQWEAAAASTHPAVGVMAEARLLQVSGTVGLVTHGPRLDAHQARCPAEQPWCVLAGVDAAVFLARVGLADERSTARARLAALENASESDPALLAAIQRRRRWVGTGEGTGEPPALGPGTWMAGLAPFGATGLGVGGAVMFTHPDVGLRGGHLRASVGGTTTGSVRAQAAYDAPGSVWWHAHLLGARYRGVALSETDTAAQWSWRTLTAGAGPGLRRTTHSIWAGPTVLLDDAASVGVTRSVGGALGAQVRFGRWASSIDGHGVTGDYTLCTGTGGVQLQSTSHRARVRLSVAPTLATAGTPLWRTPGWGGGVVLRHGGWQSLRHPVLTGTVAEVRTRPLGRFQGALYGEAAWGGQWVGGVGTGMVVRLPPSPRDALRVDVAWGTLGWGVSTGWGRDF